MLENEVKVEKKFHILHTEWSSGWGGQEQRIILECRKAKERGHEVLIACQPGSGIQAKAQESGIPTAIVVMRSGFDLRAIRQLVRLIRSRRIDVVNTHSGKDTWLGSIAARLAGARLLVRTRHLSIPLSTSPFNFVHRMADGIITTGEAIRHELITRNRLPAERILSIATGVSIRRFDPQAIDASEVRRELGLPHDAQVVTMVAVLRSMKRHDLFVEAARLLSARFPAARFLIVGEGPGLEWVEGLVRDAGLQGRIPMTGYRQDIERILAASDVVALTSDRFEGVPQSLSQAMAMGLPVVAAPVGSIAELVRDGETGLMATCGDAASFADAIGRLLDDPALRRRIGEAASRHILESYTDDIMIDRTIVFYDQLLKRREARR
jgi:glycosyltransferase involved in cell wall biosynthesis